MSKSHKINGNPENIGKTNWDDYLKSYYEKPTSFKTWSGLDLQEIYTPEDRPKEKYEKDIADAGTYPFTRGIHGNMFRGRFWTKREIVGRVHLQTPRHG